MSKCCSFLSVRVVGLLLMQMIFLPGIKTNFSFNCAGGPYCTCPGEDVQVTCQTMSPFLELLVECPLLDPLEMDFNNGDSIGYAENRTLENAFFKAELLVNSSTYFVANLSYNTQNISINTTVTCTDGFNASNSNKCPILLYSAPDRVENLKYDNNTGILSWNASQTPIPIEYKITMDPPLIAGNASFITNNTWINITSLNTSHIVTVVAINCAGEGKESTYTINFPKPGSTVMSSFQQTSSKTFSNKSSFILQTPNPSPTVIPNGQGGLDTGAIAGSITGLIIAICIIIGIIIGIVICIKYEQKKNGIYKT